MIWSVPPTVNDPMWFGGRYELVNLIVISIMFVHCLYYRGKWDTLKIFVIGMLYGLFLENSGTMYIPGISAGFFYERNYNLYLFEFFGVGYRLSQVPLVTHMGWALIFYVSLMFWEKIAEAFPKIRNNVVLGGLIISASGLLIDLQVDIFATRFNWWVWNTAYAPMWFGVPLINYIAWFTAVGVFGGLWVWIHSRHADWSKKKQTIRLLLLLPIVVIVDGVVFFALQELFGLAGIIWSGAPIF